MSVSSSMRGDAFWSFAWWVIALVAAIVAFFIVSFLIPSDPAGGLIIGGVTFILVGALMVRFGPGPGPNAEVWHDPDAPVLPHAHSTPAPAPVAPVAEAPAARAAEPVMPASVPVAPPVVEPAAAVAPVPPDSPASPVGAPISERVRDAARAAGEAARAMATDASAPVPEPVKPAAMAAPEAGGGDDLKKIKGVGPKLEELLHSLGIYHFSQVSAWGPAEVAWMDSNLEGFFGRVTRDDWVGQASLLAAGGETEFSKRVDEGDVY